MANYATLKSAIQDVVKTNGNNEITGALLQQSLIAMINSLGAYYQFAGIATPDTNPGTPDQNIAYIGGSGTYPNFGNITVEDGQFVILTYNGAWHTNIIGNNSLLKLAGATLNLGNYERQNIWDSNGSWLYNSTNYIGIVIPVIPGAKYKIVANNQLPARFSFVTALPTQSGSSVSYATGESLHILSENETLEIVAPNNAIYLWVGVSYYSNNVLPASVSIIGKIEELQLATDTNTLSIAQLDSLTQQLVDEIGNLDGDINGVPESVITPDSVVSTNCYINAGVSPNTWLVNNANQGGRIIEVTPGRTVKIKANSTNSSYIAFVKSEPVSGGTVQYATGETGRRVISSGQELILTVPSDAVYLWFAKNSYSSDFTPQSIVFEGTTGLKERVQDLENDVEQIKEQLGDVEFIITPIPLYGSTDNHFLYPETGRAYVDSSYILKKYAVQSGQELKLNLAGNQYGTYQFQTQANLPSGAGDTNPYRIGSTVTGDVNDIIIVPAGAEYLIVSQLKTVTTNSVGILSYANPITKLKFENGGIGEDGKNNPSWRENNFFRCFRTGNYIKASKLYYTPVGSEIVTVFTYTGEMKLIEKTVITGDFTPNGNVAFMKVQIFYNLNTNKVNVAISQGGLDSSGIEESSQNWVRTGYIDISNPGFDSMWIIGKVKYRIYDSNFNILVSGDNYARGQENTGGLIKFSTCLEILDGSALYSIKESATYIRFAFANETESAITPSNYDLRFTLGDLPHIDLPEILASNYSEFFNEYVSLDTISFAYKFNAAGNGQQVSINEVSLMPTLYDNKNYYSSGVLLLPPNYSPMGKPVPLIIYVHGSGDYGYLGQKVFSNFYMEYLQYWQKEGFAVVDFFARTSKYGSNGGDVNGMPTNLASYEQGYKWLIEHYNIDRSGCFIGAKSMGGVGALLICYSSAIPVKAADLFAPALNPFYQQCGYGIPSRKDYIFDLRLDNADGLITNPSPAAPMEQNDFNELMIANRDKLIGYNAYLSKVSNKSWAELVVLKFKNPGTFDDVVKFCNVPFRIHIAEDDTTVAYNQSLNLIKAMKNSGSIAEIRTLPANTGQHHATDNSPDALKVASITTELGYTCTDVPLAYVEACNWFKFYR